jgi:energy-converting hydrogenase Eha subunit C
MANNAPKNLTWIIAVILGGLGIVGHFVPIPVVSEHQYWLVAAGFVILALATKVKGL